MRACAPMARSAGGGGVDAGACRQRLQHIHLPFRLAVFGFRAGRYHRLDHAAAGCFGGERNAARRRPGLYAGGGFRRADPRRRRTPAYRGKTRAPAPAAPSPRSPPPIPRTARPAAIFWPAMSRAVRSPGCRAKPASRKKACGKSARSSPGNGHNATASRLTALHPGRLNPTLHIESAADGAGQGIFTGVRTDARPLRDFGGIEGCERG